MATNQSTQGFEQKTVIEFLMAEKSKLCEIYRRMCDKYREACFNQKNLYK